MTKPSSSSSSSSSIKSSRKRPRPTTSNDTVSPHRTELVAVPTSQVSNENDHRLTPHTLRLLKLIQDGSTEHAQRAIVLLTQCCAASTSSSTFLWNILGRLQALLTVSEWSTRIHASWAMQQIARCLPRQDQMQFLLQEQQVEVEVSVTDKSEEDHDPTHHHQQRHDDQKLSATNKSPTPRQRRNDVWLTVFDLMNPNVCLQHSENDIEPPQDSSSSSLPCASNASFLETLPDPFLFAGLDQVLQQGRPLLASTGTQYDRDYRREEAWLQTMDGAHSTTSSATATTQRRDYRQARIQFQRNVLARRLGLAGLVQVVQRPQDRRNKNKNSTTSTDSDHNNVDLLPSLTADDDYNFEELVEDKKPSVTTSGDHNKNDNNDDNDDDSKLPNAPFRALLLLEMKEQQQQRSSSSTAANSNNSNNTTSHSNPQQLLATELVYRMFDPQWQIRHGAVLGILALVRAWHKTTTTTTTTIKDHEITDNDNRQQPGSRRHIGYSFGQWPHDILTKSIALLALDRFGDYSATAMNAVVVDNTITARTKTRGIHNNKKDNDNEGGSKAAAATGSRSVVAPVREVAGQLVSMLWGMAPSSIQQATVSLLLHLSQYSLEWEVRHAGLVGLKYLVVSILQRLRQQQELRTLSTIVPVNVTKESFGCFHKEENSNEECLWYNKCLQIVAESAIQRLGDSMEDVQSVAAHILMQLLQATYSMSSWDTNYRSLEAETLVQRISLPLWSALQQPIESMSACVVDLVQLFSFMLSRNCSVVLDELKDSNNNGDHDHRRLTTTTNNIMGGTLEKILSKWMEFLVQLDIPSIQVAAMEAIGSIADPVAEFLSSWSSGDSSHQKLDGLLYVYCHLLGRIFESFFDPRLLSGMDCEDDKDRLALIQTRDRTWSRLVQVVASNFDQLQQHWNRCFQALLFRYFDIQERSPPAAQESSFPIQTEPVASSTISVDFRLTIDAANALATFLNTMRCKAVGGLINRLEFALITFLSSPWTRKCEAACLLYVALMRQMKLQGVILSCFQRETVSMLSKSPPCLIAASLDLSNAILGNSLVVRSCNDTIVAMWESFGGGDHDFDPLQCFTTVNDFWFEALKLRGLNIREATSLTDDGLITSTSMRVCATIAGAVVAGGKNSLPAKLTPVIRPLMTSIKNETTDHRLHETCCYVKGLIDCLMFQGLGSSPTDSSTSRPAGKMLTSICDMACQEPDKNSDSNAGARSVLASFVRSLPDSRQLESVTPLWCRLIPLCQYGDASLSESSLDDSLRLLKIICPGIDKNPRVTLDCIDAFLTPLIRMACTDDHTMVRHDATDIIGRMCAGSPHETLCGAFQTVMLYLQQQEFDPQRFFACELLESMLQHVGLAACSFVRDLLPIAMTLMTDPEEMCARSAARTFATLVRLAPLVERRESATIHQLGEADGVIDHLIHGLPLPPCSLPEKMKAALARSGLTLRSYQVEGISWLAFLQRANLNGALCDSMGLGKTVMALVAVALSHDERPQVKSLVVCPSSVVGHWASEVEKVFPDESIFKSICLMGTSRQRNAIWKNMSKATNLVITSYSVLRSDVETLAKMQWDYVCLDECHLLKNPKTLTARASRRLRASHKLVLSGTPVQNRVHELWATFDFLMPNFLGSSASFNREFAKPVAKGQLPGASAESVHLSMEKLKELHQQVLPFVLRREKEHVLKELPPKVITDIPCLLSDEQQALYRQLSEIPAVKRSLQTIEHALEDSLKKASGPISLGPATLKTLMMLRLLCTHPDLVSSKGHGTWRLDASGKLLALNELLRSAGVCREEVTAADNDSSILYCETDDGDRSDAFEGVLSFACDEGIMRGFASSGPSKAIIFAQFTKSLDAVEEVLFRPHMPSLRYLRLDGRVPAEERTKLAETFNNDDSISVMLLTTRVGGLGLNLTGADVVVFLEHDWNPHADLQAMDRAHRIGQTRTVNVYRLVASDSIEERIMKLQETKLATAKAIVNTENSTMYTMGTDRMLDIFTFRSDNATNINDAIPDDFLDRFQDDYSSLSMESFLTGFSE